jgi:hypothetical protein
MQAVKRDVKGIRNEDVQAREFPEREKDRNFEDGDMVVDEFIGQSQPIAFACVEHEDLHSHQD